MTTGIYERTTKIRKRISKSLKEYFKTSQGKLAKEKLKLAHTGKIHSKKTKMKMSIAHKGIKFSATWSKRKSEAQIGNKNSQWKGGRKTTSRSGYIRILKPKHPFADKRGYVLEHRLAMEKSIGRYLKPEEIIHHINGIFDDNRIENLKLFPNNKSHIQFHCDNRIIILLPPE